MEDFEMGSMDRAARAAIAKAKARELMESFDVEGFDLKEDGLKYTGELHLNTYLQNVPSEEIDETIQHYLWLKVDSPYVASIYELQVNWKRKEKFNRERGNSQDTGSGLESAASA